MKKIVAIAFLLTFLSSNTELRQLFKLPVLIHHYFEHVELDKNESLSHFLKVHYEREINHPDDVHGDHENLPFKTTDCQTAHVPVILQPLQLKFYPVIERTAVKDTKIYSIEEHYSFAHLNNIWQPPRLG